MGVLRDIAERKRTEEALRESERPLTDILEFLPDPTLVIDAQGKVTVWNRTMECMTGVPKEEIVGKGDLAYAVPFYGEPRPILIDLVFKSDKEISVGGAGGGEIRDLSGWRLPPQTSQQGFDL